MVALVTELKPIRNILVAMGLDPTTPARAPPRQGDFACNDPGVSPEQRPPAPPCARATTPSP